MKNVMMLFALLGAGLSAWSQNENVGAKLEELTVKWDQEAEGLKSYDGLSRFCSDQSYRNEMAGTLQEIHHFDSVLYKMVEKKARFGGDSEMKKTLKDIEKLQNEFSIREFLTFLSDECKARTEIEKNARKTGEDKDGEIYMLEVELQKYVKHMTKRIDVIREHVHHLGVK